MAFDSKMSDWKKGGLRYLKLKELVPAFLAPAEVQVFFVAVRRHGGKIRLVNPLTPFQREFVIAATTDGVAVLRMRRPGVFRASIAGVVCLASANDADVKWHNGRLSVCGVHYQPIAFHREDAERVAQLLRGWAAKRH